MIEQDLKHLKYRFSQERLSVNEQDIKALNNIILFTNDTAKKALDKNKLFTKLFIDAFLNLTVCHNHSSKEALKEMERLLAIPLEEYYHKMRREIPYLRFNALSEKIGIIPMYEIKEGVIKANMNENRETHNAEIIAKHVQKLELALTRTYTEKELKNFLDAELFKLIIKYASYE